MSASDETTDSMDACSPPVCAVIHDARRGWLDDHERRTLLDALGAVPRSYAFCCLHGDVSS